MPQVSESISHDQLLRSMDALMDRVSAIEDAVAGQLRPLLDEALSVMFYHLTTVRIHGTSELPNDARALGLSKDTGGTARQFVLGRCRPPQAC